MFGAPRYGRSSLDDCTGLISRPQVADYAFWPSYSGWIAAYVAWPPSQADYGLGEAASCRLVPRPIFRTPITMNVDFLEDFHVLVVRQNTMVRIPNYKLSNLHPTTLSVNFSWGKASILLKYSF